ncbi:hypothetical protein VPJ68_29670, partial [Parabacteroides distasonis]
LALSPEEIEYLHKIEKELNRPLTDSEIFGFAQINSEHCRHKIFGGTFIIDGKEMESSLFAMIKKTLLLVVFLKVLNVLDWLGLDVDGENVLVQPFVHALQHGVVLGVLAAHWEIFLDAYNAFDAHVL